MSTGEKVNGNGSRYTIRDIARIAGVSPATVSRVVNGRGQVSGELRDTVMRVVRDYGYTSSRAGRHGDATSGNSSFVGVTIPKLADLSESYFSAMLTGAGEALYDHDMDMVLSRTPDHLHNPRPLYERLARGRTRGALLILPDESDEEIEELYAAEYPFVILDPRVPRDERAPIVSAAHAAGAALAVDHLLGLGHRDIATIAGPGGWLATEERLRGYRGALGAIGVTPPLDWQIESDFTIDGGRDAATRLIESRHPPTAIFALNDMMALGAMQVVREHGLRVPEDISVVGFDDAFEARLVSPGLTTVRQPLTEMGRIAVSQLVRLLAQRRIEALHIELQTTLIIRESSGPAPATRAGHSVSPT